MSAGDAARFWLRDYPSAGRCPALADDGLCSLHSTGKPDQCAAVPLDPLVPDHLQHAVLE
ncbi:flagellin N-methylase [Caballeronia arvi]|uniref:Flagellin N-methylase n=2 Tax=Caballeronia arvi TaxID=1777135 RepID=A0A158L1N6_9BURK|nr:flagellin N-methylase [Caballeronia arvi]